MLRFRGSDCRISSSSTWYNNMYKLLMGLGFTESKVDYNHYFKVEGRIPMMLLLYVNDLFLVDEEELIKYVRSILATKLEMKDLGIMH